MTTLKTFLSGSFLFFTIIASGQKPFASWTQKELTLSNGVVQRTIQLPSPKGVFATTVYKPAGTDFKYFKPLSPEFSFLFDGVAYSGSGTWTLLSIKAVRDENSGNGARAAAFHRPI